MNDDIKFMIKKGILIVIAWIGLAITTWNITQ